MQVKTCLICAAEFERPANVSRAQWEERRFCSRKCGAAFTAEKRRAPVAPCQDCGQVLPLRLGVRCKSCHNAWRWANDLEYREAKQARNRAWQAANTDYYNVRAREERQKHNARALLNQAVARGTVKRQPCEVCGTADHLEAHHGDYSRPYDVRWLCVPHHAEAHRMERAALRGAAA